MIPSECGSELRPESNKLIREFEINSRGGWRMRPASARNMRAFQLLLSLSILAPGGCDLLRDSVHVTSAAARPTNELWCYRCLAEQSDGQPLSRSCADIRHNNSALVHKCHNDKRVCMVKRFSYTTSTENSTTALKMWALERNCTKHCDPGCIIIGERTKLYACTSCCETSLCNHGSGAVRHICTWISALLAGLLAVML